MVTGEMACLRAIYNVKYLPEDACHVALAFCARVAGGFDDDAILGLEGVAEGAGTVVLTVVAEDCYGFPLLQLRGGDGHSCQAGEDHLQKENVILDL